MELVGQLFPFIILIAIMYFIIIRPQQKQAKAHKAMLASLKKGDKVVTSGGLIVEIKKVEDKFFTIEFFGVVLSIPSLANMKEGPKVTLGLDLQGGLQMLLGVKTQDAAISRIKSIAASIKHYTSEHEILIANLNIHGTSTSFDILDSDDAKHVSSFLDKLKGVKVTHNKDTYTVTLTASDIKKIEKQAVSQAIETIRNRLDQFGLAEPLVQRQK